MKTIIKIPLVAAILIVFVVGCMTDESNGSTVRGQHNFSTKSMEEFQNRSIEIEQIPSKEEMLEEFINTADIAKIKQAYSNYTQDEIKLIPTTIEP